MERYRKYSYSKSRAQLFATIAFNKPSYDGSATPLSVIYTRACPSLITKGVTQRFGETLGILSTSVKVDPEATRFAHASAISSSRPLHFVWNHVTWRVKDRTFRWISTRTSSRMKNANFRAVTGNHSSGEPPPFSGLLLGTRPWRAQTERLWCSMADQSLLK